MNTTLKNNRNIADVFKNIPLLISWLAWSVIIGLLPGLTPGAGAATVNYTAQTANFTLVTAGSAGNYNVDGTHIGLWANGGGSGNAQASVGFHKFTTDGSLGGTVQPLRVGQQFSISFKRANSPRGINNGSVGFALKNGTTFSATSDYSSGSRMEYSFTGNDSTAKIYDSGTQSTGMPGFSSFADSGLTYTFTLISSNEYNYSVSGGTTYNILSLGGTANGALDSFSIFNRGNNDDYSYGPISVTDVALTYTANTGETKTVAGIIPDNGSTPNTVEKLGVGTVIFSGANTYSSNTTISAGTLKISSDGNLGAVPASPRTNSIIFNAGAGDGINTILAISTSTTLHTNRGMVVGANGAKLDAGANTLTVNGNIINNSGANHLFILADGNTTLNGSMSGSGDIVKQGLGVLTLNGTNNTFGTTVTNNIYFDKGTIQGASSGAFGVTNGWINIGASGDANAGDALLQLTAAGATVYNNIDSRYFTAVTTANTKTIGGNNTSGTVTFAGNIVLHDKLSITAASGGTVKVTGPIAVNSGNTTGQSTNTGNVLFSPGPGITMLGGGTVEFSGTNSYTGETYVKAGTLQFNGNTTYANSTIRLGDDVASSTATVNIANTGGGGVVNNLINPRAGAGGTKTISGNNTSGVNTYGGTMAFDTDTTVSSVNSGGTLAFTGSSFDIKNHVLTVTGAGDTTISSPVTNSTTGGSLVKTGTGTLTLSGANTWSGSTTVSNGTLVVTGTVGAGAVTVVTNATLGGNGLIKGATTVQLGGTLAPSGTFPVTLTVSNNLTLSGNGNFRVGPGQTGDKIAGVSSFTSGGTLNVTLNSGSLTGGEVFTLVQATSYSGTAPAAGTLPSLSSGQNWYLGKLAVNGTIAVNRAPAASSLSIGAQAGVLQTLPIITNAKHPPTDADSDTLSLASVTQGTNGGVVVISGGSVTYSNNATGADSFTYTVSDGRGGSATATVIVNITAVVNQQVGQLSFDGSGNALLVFWGVPGTSYIIQKSPDLSTWTNLTTVIANDTNTQPYGRISFTDTGSPSGTAGYYRLKP